MELSMDSLETPCIVVDYAQSVRNMEKMQSIADRYHCSLRPHTKTHKTVFFSQKQVEAGAKGITCAKVSEAEVMADGGLEDIFIAYPVVGDFRVKRASMLNARIPRLILGVDSLECAEALNSEALRSGKAFEIRLEVDTGAKRTGAAAGKALELAKVVARLGGLRLTGIYTFKGLVYENQPTTDMDKAGLEEGRLMHEVYESFRSNGIGITEISAGSTPTGESVASTGLVSEIRPGTYIFYDYMCYKEGACGLDEIAATMLATVVSTPSDGYAVIDGGSKTFPTDVPLNVAPYYYPGFAVVAGHEDLCLTRLSEEHGMLFSRCGHTGLKVGQRLKLFPLHICPAINLHNSFYLLKDGKISVQKVDARGMLV